MGWFMSASLTLRVLVSCGYSLSAAPFQEAQRFHFDFFYSNISFPAISLLIEETLRAKLALRLQLTFLVLVFFQSVV